MPIDLLTGEVEGEEAGFSFKRMGENIIPSGKKLVEDTLQPILHPLDTIEGLGALGSGIGQMLASDNPVNYPNPQNVEAAKGVGDYYVDRYSNPLETLQEDPMGMLADAASIATLGSAGLAKAGIKGAKTARNVAAALDPMAAPTNIAKAMPSRYIYRQGMKFNHKPKTGVTRAKAKDLANQAYDLDILGNDLGAERLAKAKILRGQAIDDAVKGMPDNRSIPTDNVGRYLGEERASMLGTGNKSKSTSHIKQYDAATEDYMNRLAAQHGDMMTPQEVQGVKVGRYKEATPGAYNEAPKLPAEQQANKAMGRGAKEALEQRNPDLRGLNESYADIDRISDAIGWQDPHAFGTDYSARVITGSAGASQPVTSAAGLLSHILRSKADSTGLLLKHLGQNPTSNNALRQILRQSGIASDETNKKIPKDLLEGIEAFLEENN